jgi:hypothetical protein
MAHSADLLFGIARGSLELGDREVLTRIDEIDQVVANLTPFAERWLRRGEIHAAVHAHGINADDLDISSTKGQLVSELRLPRGRRTDEGDDRRAHVAHVSSGTRIL